MRHFNILFTVTVAILTCSVQQCIAEECNLQVLEFGNNKAEKLTATNVPQSIEFSNPTHGWQLKCTFWSQATSPDAHGFAMRTATIDCSYPDGQIFRGSTKAIYQNGALKPGSNSPWSLLIFGKETKVAVDTTKGGSYKGGIQLSLNCK